MNPPGEDRKTAAPRGAGAPDPRGTLVIGYGNPLRNDDAVGRHLVERLPDSAGIRESLVLHQLQMELADDMSRFERVLFVDADPGAPTPRLERLEEDDSAGPLSHHLTPGRLLALCRVLYGRSPEAFTLGLPAANLEFGETLSDAAMRGIETALERLTASDGWFEGSGGSRDASSPDLANQ